MDRCAPTPSRQWHDLKLRIAADKVEGYKTKDIADVMILASDRVSGYSPQRG